MSGLQYSAVPSIWHVDNFCGMHNEELTVRPLVSLSQAPPQILGGSQGPPRKLFRSSGGFHVVRPVSGAMSFV